MYISASLFTAPGNLENKLNLLDGIKKDLIHLDFVDDYDLNATLNNLKEKNIFCDVHIVSKKPKKILDELFNNKLLNYPKFIFVQIDDLEIEETNIISSYQNVYPAIKVNEDLDVIKFKITNSKAILLMTTTPGKSGGKFNPEVYHYIDKIREYNSSIKIYVDGGVTDEHYGKLYSKGVHTVVIGSYLVKASNFNQSYSKLKSKLDLGIQLISLADPIEHLPIVYTLKLDEILNTMLKYRSNFVFSFDKNNTFQGLITDGDIKRKIIKYNLKTSLDSVQIMPNSDFKMMQENSTVEDLIDAGLFERRFGAIPLTDSDGKFTSALNLSKIME